MVRFMKEVGAFEAKTHLSELLELARQGEEILITRRGVPVAKLVPATRVPSAAAKVAFQKLNGLREQSRLGGLDWKSLRDEGRR
jgi:prevent-host-death family protein